MNRDIQLIIVFQLIILSELKEDVFIDIISFIACVCFIVAFVADEYKKYLKRKIAKPQKGE